MVELFYTKYSSLPSWYGKIMRVISYSLVSVLTCGAPILAKGLIGRYNTTTVSSEVFYHCQKSGFVPSEPRSKCGEDVRWTPDPSQVVCRMMTPKENLGQYILTRVNLYKMQVCMLHSLTGALTSQITVMSQSKYCIHGLISTTG